MRSHEAIELALALHAEPARSADLRERPVPAGVADLLRLAAGNESIVAEAVQFFGRPPPQLIEAARFFVEQQLLARECAEDPWRVLGANPGASARRLSEHRRLLVSLIHPDRSPDWASAYSDRLHRAWRTLLAAPGGLGSGTREVSSSEWVSSDSVATWRPQREENDEWGGDPSSSTSTSTEAHDDPIAPSGVLIRSEAEGTDIGGVNAAPRSVRRHRPLAWAGLAAALVLVGLFVLRPTDDPLQTRPDKEFVRDVATPAVDAAGPAQPAATESLPPPSVQPDDRSEPGIESDIAVASSQIEAMLLEEASASLPAGDAEASSDAAQVVMAEQSEVQSDHPPQSDRTLDATALAMNSEQPARNARQPARAPSVGRQAPQPPTAQPVPTSADTLAAVASDTPSVMQQKPALAEPEPFVESVFASLADEQPPAVAEAPSWTEVDTQVIDAGLPRDADVVAALDLFVRLYSDGDLQGVLSLFSRHGRPDGGAAIARDYAELFNTTRSRSLSLSSLQWRPDGERLRGEGRFEARYLSKGRLVRQVVRGRIDFEVVREGDVVRFARLDAVAENGAG